MSQLSLCLFQLLKFVKLFQLIQLEFLSKSIRDPVCLLLLPLPLLIIKLQLLLKLELELIKLELKLIKLFAEPI